MVYALLSSKENGLLCTHRALESSANVQQLTYDQTSCDSSAIVHQPRRVHLRNLCHKQNNRKHDIVHTLHPPHYITEEAQYEHNRIKHTLTNLHPMLLHQQP